MMKNKSYPLLRQTPKDFHSDDFLIFLRQKNKVVFENDQWLVIENSKYHTKKSPWLTAFHKPKYNEVSMWYENIDILWLKWPDWKWVKKEARKQTVKRFHIHLIKEHNELPE